jgi:hypothetical protein
MKFAIDLVLNSIGEDGFARGIKKLISSNQLRFNYDSNFARNARNSGFNNSVDATNTVFRDEQSRFRSAEIVLGDQALRSPASAIVAVVHELAHVYQAQNNYAGDRNQIEIKAYTLSNQVTTELANRFSQSSNTAERELASEIRGLLTIEQRALQSYIRDAQRR